MKFSMSSHNWGNFNALRFKLMICKLYINTREKYSVYTVYSIYIIYIRAISYVRKTDFFAEIGSEVTLILWCLHLISSKSDLGGKTSLIF